MSKCVLVMDMPKDCLHCKLRKVLHIGEKAYQHCGLDANGYCLESFFKQDDLKDGFKSEHCPLKQMPDKKIFDSVQISISARNCGKTEMMLSNAHINGYNACIDELLKGEEG